MDLLLSALPRGGLIKVYSDTIKPLWTYIFFLAALNFCGFLVEFLVQTFKKDGV